MNKIFKVVWSKTKECYVVVSEVAKNNGGKKKALASVLAGLAMVAATAGTPVHADVGLGGSSVNISPNGTYNGSNSVTPNSIVVGYQNRTTGGSGNGHVIYGANNVANQDSSMALGNQNVATGPAASAIGVGSQATGRNTIAVGNVAKASNTDNIAIGTYSEALTSGQDAYALAVGSYSKANAHMAVGIGALANATGTESTAVGAGSKATAKNSQAFGARNTASGQNATAIGYGNTSAVEDTITVGTSNTASVGGGIAIGQNNIANSGGTAGNTMIAIGRENEATAQDTVAIGRRTKATENVAVALGARSEATGSGAVALGGNGDGYKTTATQLGSVAIGMQSTSTGVASTAVGGVSQATAKGASALGFKANASAESATALGQESSASIKDGVALGSQSKTSIDKGVKGFNPAETRTNKYSGLTGNVQTSTLAAVSVGDGANATRQITGLAAGTADSDAVNVAQLRSVNLKYAGDTGNGDVLLDDGTLKIKGDDPTFISTSADKNGVTVKAKIGADITNTNGKAVAPTTNGIATTDNVAKAINESGWNVVSSNNGGSVTGTQASKKVSPGDTVTLSAGKNIVLDQTDKQFTYSLNKDVDLTKDGSLTIGDTKVNNDGLTITGGPSVTKTGIDAGNKNITNVKAGVNDTDAVNVKQLKDAKTKLVDGKNTKVTGEGTQDDPYKVNVEGDLKGITSISNADNGPKMTIGGNSINITGGPLNMGGSKITNVAPGTDDTDAVNVKQLKSAKTEVKAGNGVTVAKSQDATDGHDIYTVSSTGATGNTDPSKVEGGKNTTVTGDGTAATPYKVNVQGDLKDISSITNGDGSGKISFAGDQVVKVEGDNPISLDGKGGYVTGLQNKDWDITNPTVVSGRAATEDQLKKVSDGFNNTIKLAGNTGNTDTQKFNKTGGLSFGVVGANNGQYIKTTASGTDVVADLSDDAKAKLNHTFEVAPGSSNVTVSKDTTDPNKTVYKVAVANTPAAGASSTESVVKKAATTGDTNIADVTVGNGKNSGDPDAQYEVNVSRNAVKDAAREAVTVNNGGTTTGGNYTADADNPITVNPVKDDAKHNTTYEVKFDGEKAAKQIPLTYKANGTGDQKVKLDKGLNFTNGSNTTASVAADGVVKYDLNKDVDLTKNGSLTIGDTKVNNDGVTITGGPSVTKTGIDAGNKTITNVAPAVNGTDAVNLDQLKAARTVVTSNDKSVTINKTENGNQVTYDLHVNAAAGTASTWNIASDKVSGTEGTVAAGSNAAQNIADGKTVTMQAGKNLTVNQTNDGNGNASVAFALDKDLKDLDSVTTGKTITKEITLKDPSGTGETVIKKDGDRITYTNDGGTTVHKVANLKDEKHITATTAGNEYTVDNDGNVTMTYTDGNGDLVTGEKAVIKGVAKNDLSNINNAGKNVITGLGTIVKGGENVNVTVASDATTGQKTYTVNAVTPAVYTKADGTKVVKRPDGTFTTNVDGAPGNDVPASDVIVSIQDAAGNTTGGNSIVNNVGSAIKNQTGADYLTKLDTANGLTPNAAVNVSDLKSTADALRANELHIAPTAVKAGSTEAKGGVVSGTENVYKYDAATKKVTLTYNDGKGTAVSDTKAVIDFSDLNIPAAGNNYGFKANAIAGDGKLDGAATATAVENGGTVNFAAGKNLTVKQTVDAANKTQTYTYSLDKDLTNLDKVVVNGKDGQAGKDGVTIVGPQGATGAPGLPGTNGIDGKVGISGKDGKDAVSISGKDGVGHIGLTGPAGKDGKNATADITVKEGKAGVDGKDGVDGITRIFYNDKDGNEHQVATHDDGMKFAGDDGQTDDTKVLKKHLNNVVDIVGGADKNKLTTNDNIGVNNVNGKLKVQLAKNVDLDADGSLTTGNTKVDNNGVTITAPAGGTTTDVKLTNTGLDNGGNKIVNVKAGENDTDAVNVKQLKDKVTTVESSDSSIKVVDKNVAGQPGYDAAKGHQYDIKINNQGVVNNAQIPVVYTKQDGTKVYKQPDGTFNTAKDGSGDVVNAGDIIASMNNPNASTTDPMKLNNVGSSIADKAGNTFLDKIDAAAGDNNTKNGAVNVTDLKNTADAIGNKGLNFGAQSGNDIHKNLGEKLEIVGEGTKADDNYSASNIKTMTKDGKVVIGLDKDLNGLNSISVPGKNGVDGKDGVSISGKDGANGIDGKVSIGKDGKDAVSIAGKDGVGHIGLTGPQGPAGADGTGVDISTDHGSKTLVKPEANNGDKSERIVYVPKDKDGNPLKDTDGNPIKREVATMDDGLKFTGNNTGTENKHALNTLVKVQGEGVTAAQSTAFQSAAGNINVVADGNDTLTVKLNKDLKGINSIKNSDNGPALNFNAGDLAVTGGNLNMGGNKITNLGKGTNDTDAVNLKQLKDSRTIVKSTDGTVGVQESETTDGAKVYDLTTGASPRFDELTDEIGRVGAQGAALAALKPIQYDPLEPTQIMAGYGNYRGNSAIAMGVAHYKNESTMMHAGLAWAGGSRHMMANAGVTWKVGNRDSEAAVADRYRKGPISSAYAMQQEMASVKAQNAGLKTEVSDLKAENEQMKAQIAAMMAKLGM
ncbi:hypothetical protein GL282_05925 [Veillonella dispar]|nr:hypothetical protein [Veillonella dispar]